MSENFITVIRTIIVKPVYIKYIYIFNLRNHRQIK